MNAPGDAPRRPSLAERVGRLRETPGSAAIIVACVAVYAFVASRGDTSDGLLLLRYGASERSHIWRGEYWRLVTPMFLHGGLLHLGVNLFFGSSWNIAIERVLGTRRFLLLYLLSGVFGTCASVLLHDGISVGASGAMFGMVGAVLALQLRAAGSFGRFIRNPGVHSLVFSVALWIAIGFSATGIDNWAHLGGFTYGGVLGWVLTAGLAPRPEGGAVPPARDAHLAHRVEWAIALTILAFAATATCRRWPRQRARYGAYEAFRAARAADAAGDEARARRELDRAIDYDDSVPDYYAARGVVREKSGDFAGAADDYGRALRVAPSSWEGREATRHDLETLSASPSESGSGVER